MHTQDTRRTGLSNACEHATYYVAGICTWVCVRVGMWAYECGWANTGVAEGAIHAAYRTIVYIVYVVHTYVIEREKGIHTYIGHTRVLGSLDVTCDPICICICLHMCGRDHRPPPRSRCCDLSSDARLIIDDRVYAFSPAPETRLLRRRLRVRPPLRPLVGDPLLHHLLLSEHK